MPEIDIQFYASADEIATMVRSAVKDESVHLVTLMSDPFVVKEIGCGEVDYVVKHGPSGRLRFLIGAPDVSVEYTSDFDRRHGDQLVLDVGRLCSFGLNQSWLTCRTENLDAIKVWRRIARTLKEMTKAGATFINRQSGASAVYHSVRYTDGAKLLESRGVAMLPPQGPNGPTVKLGEVRES